jgi:MFS family permease
MESEPGVISESKVKKYYLKSICLQVLLVLLMSCVVFSTYFCMEMPSGLEKYIIEIMELTTFDYNLLYSLYFWPTILLAPVGGAIIDMFSVQVSLPLFVIVSFGGQVIWSVSAFTNQYWLAVLGRVVSGSGGEMVFISLASYVAICFKNKLYSINGILLGVARFGATVSVNVNSLLFELTGFVSEVNLTQLGLVLLIGGFIMLMAFATSLLLWLAYSFTTYRYTITSRRKLSQLLSICKFPPSYFVIVAIAGIYYAAVLSPASIGELYYMNKYNISIIVANLINGLVHFLAVFLCPLFGFLIDRVGFNLSWIMTSILIGTVGHSLLALGNSATAFAYTGSVLGGLSYSMFTVSLWPMVSLIVEPEHIGIAYGIQGSVISGFQVLIGATVGIMADNYGYFIVQLFYSALCLLALSLVIILCIADRAGIIHKRLNISRLKSRKRS